MPDYSKPNKRERDFWDDFDRKLDAIFSKYPAEWNTPGLRQGLRDDLEELARTTSTKEHDDDA